MEITRNSEIKVLPLSEIRSNFSSDKKMIICPSTSGNIVLKPNSLIDTVLKSIQTNETITLEKLFSQFEHTDKNSISERVITLFKKGLISIDNRFFSVPSTENGAQNMLRKSTQHINLCVFHMHNYCNLACDYCYLANAKIKKTINLDTMIETVQKIIHTGSKKINFEFHGGEPTMSMPLIMKFVELVKKDYSESFETIRFSIQTNGYNIRSEHIKFMADNNFSVRVSLDGDEENHDAHRVTGQGKPTYQKIIENINEMNKKGIFPEVCCVVHKNNLHLLKHFYKTFKTLNISGIRFLPIFEVEDKSLSYYMDGKEYAEELINLLESSDVDIRIFTNLISGELANIKDFSRSYMCLKSPCGAGTNMIGIDVSGGVYPCEEMIVNPIFKIGNIFDGEINEMLANSPICKTLAERSFSTISRCLGCEWKNFCHSGCPMKSYDRYKNFSSPSDMCQYYKIIFPYLLEKYSTKITENEVYKFEI